MMDNQEPTNLKFENTQPTESPAPPKRWKVILLGLIILLFCTGIGAGVGYASGIQQRLAQQNNQRLIIAATHFNYGVQAMLSGNFEVAKIQFEYVIEIAPDFPGIQEKYTETMVELAKSSLSTPTVQAIATPDTRDVEAIFAQAQQEVYTRAWLTALQTLNSLRDQDLYYRALEVDGLYYLTLRSGAIEKIMQEGDLEGGLYYLSLAGRFAPLDHEANNYALWARMYQTGISYWEVDWEKVIYYFSQLYQAAPGVHDSSGWSASGRYRVALIYYGDYKVSLGEFCEAVQYYQTSINIQYDASVEQKLNNANLACQGPALTAQAAASATAAVTPEITIPELPTEEITPTP